MPQVKVLLFVISLSMVWVCLLVKYFNIITDGLFHIWAEITPRYNIMMYSNRLAPHPEGERRHSETLG